jgi:hypothetical protein
VVPQPAWLLTGNEVPTLIPLCSVADNLKHGQAAEHLRTPQLPHIRLGVRHHREFR